ncbi:iron-containing alcohol dehydrogenase family protein [Antrihabitans sp. YC2-6]|uniref:iron-containing alcohol dehydrogenase family protein n=1 Tax=Antrihabitans sp. YC2-6 TaxID=2799498 RepID=UPI0018F5DA15|nr:iron-containing alcohol dehydrogenase [Antrihabitans sp. YC2-6]MBJ8348258.1 iron-containing alcohol dehydrogenase [Antrihabitans sp. YC2-6]
MATDTLFPSRHFSVDTDVISGIGALSELAASVRALGATRVAVVADRGVAAAGLLDRMLTADVPVFWTGLADVNPNVAACDSAVAAAQEAECDAVIGVGGGSALGLAKALAIMLTNPGSILDYEGTGRVKMPGAPLIAIPTTAGSGSEVSNALVLHEPGRLREVVVRGRGCEPNVAILDGSSLRELPRAPMLHAALDALTHACEALWTQNRTVMSDALAEKAARSIIDVLPAALDRRDDNSLQQLMEASTAANLACGNTGLGLVHALSSAPTTPLPHGYQNGALLLAVAEFNWDAIDAGHHSLLARIPALFAAVGWPGHFGHDDLDTDRIEAMIAATVDHPFRTNNFRPSNDEQLRGILAAAHTSWKEIGR